MHLDIKMPILRRRWLYFGLSLALVLLITPFMLTASATSNRVQTEEVVDIVTILHVGSVVTVSLAEDVSSLVQSTSTTFYLTVIYGTEANWEAAVLLAFDSSQTTSLQYFLGDPFQDPIFWIPGDESMVEILGSVVEITFIEYTPSASPVKSIALAFTDTSPLEEIELLYSILITNFLSEIQEQTSTLITSSSTTMTTSQSRSADISNTSDGFSQIPGFKWYIFLTGLFMLYLLKHRLKNKK